jgi:hypothetical protein
MTNRIAAVSDPRRDTVPTLFRITAQVKLPLLRSVRSHCSILTDAKTHLTGSGAEQLKAGRTSISCGVCQPCVCMWRLLVSPVQSQVSGREPCAHVPLAEMRAILAC